MHGPNKVFERSKVARWPTLARWAKQKHRHFPLKEISAFSLYYKIKKEKEKHPTTLVVPLCHEQNS
jgi:hypothetical protein